MGRVYQKYVSEGIGVAGNASKSRSCRKEIRTIIGRVVIPSYDSEGCGFQLCVVLLLDTVP